ncbi:RNA polymerase sigma factor [Nafulsella turpanensis]|uniref:RNA polymerase sigma factor n=1 Tax=Nafulsella turpanensis TaxID=1265690 RepID=UPI00034810B9|nr:RNA polymerase sigma factor [Nafulsella turpanensis]
MKFSIRKSGKEETLLRGCRENDSRSQRELYQQWAPKMLGLCLRYVKDRSEAESVMTGGFLKIFERIDQFSGEGSFEGWMRRIMVNESLTYLRQHKHTFMMVDAEEASLEVSFENAEQNLQTEDLMAMIQRLPDGYRTIFNLYAIEGFSHKEIAEKLEISESTSKSQLSRARSLLQQQLARHNKLIEKQAI